MAEQPPPPPPPKFLLPSAAVKIKIPLTFVNNSEVAAFICLLATTAVSLGAELLLRLADVWTHGHIALYKISCWGEAPWDDRKSARQLKTLSLCVIPCLGSRSPRHVLHQLLPLARVLFSFFFFFCRWSTAAGARTLATASPWDAREGRVSQLSSCHDESFNLASTHLHDHPH